VCWREICAKKANGKSRADHARMQQDEDGKEVPEKIKVFFEDTEEVSY